jgi:hypothetical protein
MTKRMLVGVAALALMSSGAFAQTVVETTRSTTVAPVAPVESSTTVRTEKNTFGGASVEKQQHYQTGPNGTVSSSESKVVRPDGSSESSYKKEWSTAPAPAPVVPYGSSSTTTTTTINR